MGFGLTVVRWLSQVDVKDLQTIATLGVGAFGKVTLVKHRQALYALKSIGKAHVVSTNMLRHITREREAMKQLSSPFTVNLVATFQDRDNVYMLLERVMGGEFFSLLHNLDQAPSEKHVRFYAACVIEVRAPPPPPHPRAPPRPCVHAGRK
jgi:serine/threonine protein kinase